MKPARGSGPRLLTDEEYAERMADLGHDLDEPVRYSVPDHFDRMIAARVDAGAWP